MTYSISFAAKLFLISVLLHGSFSLGVPQLTGTENYLFLDISNSKIVQLNLSSSYYSYKKFTNFHKLAGSDNSLYLYFKDSSLLIDVVVSNADIGSYLDNISAVPQSVSVQLASTSQGNINLFKFNVDGFFQSFASSDLYVYYKLSSGLDTLVSTEMLYTSRDYLYTSNANSKLNVYLNSNSMNVIFERKPEASTNVYIYFKNSQLAGCQFSYEKLTKESPFAANLKVTEIFDKKVENSAATLYVELPKSGLAVSEYFYLRVSGDSSICSGELLFVGEEIPTKLDVLSPSYFYMKQDASVSISILNEFSISSKALKISSINGASFSYGLDSPATTAADKSPLILLSVSQTVLNLKTTKDSIFIVEFILPIKNLSADGIQAFSSPKGKFILQAIKLSDKTFQLSKLALTGNKEIKNIYFKIDASAELSLDYMSLPFSSEVNSRMVMSGSALNGYYASLDNIDKVNAYAYFLVRYTDSLTLSVARACRLFEINKEQSFSVAANASECFSFNLPSSTANNADIMFNLFVPEKKEIWYSSAQLNIPKVKAQQYQNAELKSVITRGVPRVFIDNINSSESMLVFSFYLYSNALASDVDTVAGDRSINAINKYMSWSFRPNYDYFVYFNRGTDKEENFQKLYSSGALKRVSNYFMDIPVELVNPFIIYVFAINKSTGVVIKYGPIKTVGKGAECLDINNINIRYKTSLEKKRDSVTKQCVSSCKANECYDNEYVCLALSKDNLQGNDLRCLKVCDSAQCYISNQFVCQTASEGNVAQNDGLECGKSCKDLDYCYDNTFVCGAPSDSFLSNHDGGLCTDKCKNPSNCFKDNEFICSAPTQSNVSNQDSGMCTDKCSKLEFCHYKFACIKPEINFLSHNDGSECTTKCRNSKQCFDPSTFKCMAPASGLLSNDDGGICTQRCLNPNKCVNPSTFVCQNPSQGLVSNTDGSLCTAKCVDSKKCFGSDFICKAPSQDSLSEYNGGACIAKCSSKVNCFDKDTFICGSPSVGKVSNSDGGVCTGSCSNSNFCYENSKFVCQSPSSGKISNLDGGICTDRCNDLMKCFNTSNFTCQQPQAGLLSNKDGDACTAACKDSSKCINSSFTCTNCEFESINLNSLYTRLQSKTAPFVGRISSSSFGQLSSSNYIYLGCRSCDPSFAGQFYLSYSPISFDGLGNIISFDLLTPVSQLALINTDLNKVTSNPFVFIALKSDSPQKVPITFEIISRPFLMINASRLASSSQIFNYRLNAGSKMYVLGKKKNDFSILNNAFEGQSSFKISSKFSIYHLINPAQCDFESIKAQTSFVFVSNPGVMSKTFIVEVTAIKNTIGELSFIPVSNPVFSTSFATYSNSNTLDFIYYNPTNKRTAFVPSNVLADKFKSGGLMTAYPLSMSKDSGIVDLSLTQNIVSKFSPYMSIHSSLPGGITFSNKDVTSADMYMYFRFNNEVINHKANLMFGALNNMKFTGQSTASAIRFIEVNLEEGNLVKVLSTLSITSSTGLISNVNFRFIDLMNSLKGDKLYDSLYDNDFNYKTTKATSFNFDFKSFEPKDKKYYLMITFSFERVSSGSGDDAVITITRNNFNPMPTTSFRITLHADDTVNMVRIGNYIVTPNQSNFSEFEYDYTTKTYINDGDVITLIASDATFGAGHAIENWNGYCIEGRFEFTDKNGQYRNIVTNLSEWKCDGMPPSLGYRLVREHPRLLEAVRIWGPQQYGTTICSYVYREEPKKTSEVSVLVMADDFVLDVKIGDFIWTPLPAFDVCKLHRFTVPINVLDGTEFMIRGMNGFNYSDPNNASAIYGKFSWVDQAGQSRQIVTDNSWKCNGQQSFPGKTGYRFNELDPAQQIWVQNNQFGVATCVYQYKIGYKGPVTKEDAGKGSIYYLDRINYKCDQPNSAISSLVYYVDEAANLATFDVQCYQHPSISNDCQEFITPDSIVFGPNEAVTEEVSRTRLNFLDRQPIICPAGQALKRFQMERHQNLVFYRVNCCKATFQAIYNDNYTVNVPAKQFSTAALNGLKISAGKPNSVLTGLRELNDYNSNTIYYYYQYAEIKLN